MAQVGIVDLNPVHGRIVLGAAQRGSGFAAERGLAGDRASVDAKAFGLGDTGDTGSVVEV